MLNYVVHDMPVEIGHLASQVSDRYVAPTGRRHAYVVVRLPERLPHMIVSFGHLSRVLDVRIAPDQWHLPVLEQIGGGRHRASLERAACAHREPRNFDGEFRGMGTRASPEPGASSRRRRSSCGCCAYGRDRRVRGRRRHRRALSPRAQCLRRARLIVTPSHLLAESLRSAVFFAVSCSVRACRRERQKPKLGEPNVSTFYSRPAAVTRLRNDLVSSSVGESNI